MLVSFHDLSGPSDDPLRQSTAAFPNVLLGFLDRIFKMLENLPLEHGTSQKRSSESSLVRNAMYTVSCT